MNLQLRRLEKRFDLARYLEQFDGTMSGNNFVMTCPQCNWKHPTLYILTEDKLNLQGEMVKRGSWVCYYCIDQDGGVGSGRTCLSLIEWLEDVEFTDAIKRLADGGTSADADFIGALEQAFAALVDQDDKADEPIPEIRLPKEFIAIGDGHYPPYVFEPYPIGRGISLERAKRFRLGYCLKGKYANRLIAPVYFNSRCVGFQARWMAKTPPMVKDKETGEMVRISKTKHAKGAKMSRVLYNWDEAKHQKQIVLIESPWASIKIGKKGSATFGKHLSSAQLELVLTSEADEVILMWDRDKDHAPGKGGYEKSLKFAEKLAQVLRVRAVKLPRDIDRLNVQSLARLIEATPVLSANDAWLAKTASWMRAL